MRRGDQVSRGFPRKYAPLASLMGFVEERTSGGRARTSARRLQRMRPAPVLAPARKGCASDHFVRQKFGSNSRKKAVSKFFRIGKIFSPAWARKEQRIHP